MPTNDERATWAMQSAAVLADNTGMSLDDELADVLGDQLANMMHLCSREGMDFENLLTRARMHFEAESS